MAAFTGFSGAFVRFFSDLEKNNSREWFKERKQFFDENITATMIAFVEAVGEQLPGISRQFVASPRVNGSIFRIYRDTRFSANKAPYKTHAAAIFYHRQGAKHEFPGFYFQIAPKRIFWGAGHYMVPPDQLQRLREFIAKNPQAWQQVISEKQFKNRFSALDGERLKRPPKGFPADHPLINDLKLKSFVAGCEEETDKFINSPKIVAHTIEIFKDAAPFVEVLCMALGVPF